MRSEKRGKLGGGQIKIGDVANGEIIGRLSSYISHSGDPELRTAKAKRGGIVEITTSDGATLREHVEYVRGRPGNPMSDKEIEVKCADLMVPVLGEDRTRVLIDQIWNLEKVTNMRDLRPLLSVP